MPSELVVKCSGACEPASCTTPGCPDGPCKGDLPCVRPPYEAPEPPAPIFKGAQCPPAARTFGTTSKDFGETIFMGTFACAEEGLRSSATSVATPVPKTETSNEVATLTPLTGTPVVRP